jgi:hypothetical protein
MSKQGVTAFFDSLVGEIEHGISAQPTAAEVVETARQRGFEFAEDELHSVMKEMIHTAQSLPRGWGWKLARHMKLVRET